MARTGYMNGSDMLLYISTTSGGSSVDKAIGHCTSHSVTYSADTKDRAVKALASVTGNGAGLWKEQSVTGLSIEIQFEGLRFYADTEEGFADLLAAWKTGQPVTVKCMPRAESSTAENAYLVGSFVFSSLTESHPANDDSTYSGSLKNNGEPSTFSPTDSE